MEESMNFFHGIKFHKSSRCRFVFVACVTVISFLHWFMRSIRRNAHTAYVKRQLRALDRINRETDLHASRFAAEYLRHDGVFVLRLIAKNAGELIASEVTAGLFQAFQKERRLVVDVNPAKSAAPPGATQYGDPMRSPVGVGLMSSTPEAQQLGAAGI